MTLARALARIVIRPTDDPQSPGDLILGALFKAQSDLLRPGTVYEIREVMGTLTIVPIGPSAIGRNVKESLIPNVHWLGTPDQIIGNAGKHWVLTREEYLQACGRSEPVAAGEVA